MQTLSPRGSDLIKGFESMKLRAYKDGAGIVTAGYGHTGPEVKFGAQYTLEVVLAWFASDSLKAQHTVIHNTDQPLTQNQFDALVSFCFNIGVDAFVRSTLLKLVNAGKAEEAAEEFVKWDHITVEGEKVESAGLKKRRCAERALFLEHEDASK